MSDFFDRLSEELEVLGRNLNELPWFYHAIAAVFAFVLFLLVAAAVML